MAAKANIILEQGTSFETTVTIQDSDETALNLTGYTAASQLRKSYASANSTSFTVTITNANSGILTLAMPANTSQTLSAGRYVYDLEIYASSNTTVTRVVEGIVTVTPGVTRGSSETV